MSPDQHVANVPTKPKKKKHFKMWSAFSILLLIIAILIFTSWILKWSGVTVKMTIDHVEQNVPINALGILDLFVAPVKGFIEKADVIIFIMIVGAFIYMVIASKALEGSSQVIIAKFKGKEIWAIIPLMLVCSIGGTTFGFSEETFGFYLILIPLMLAAGFDTMTGLLIVSLGAGIGIVGSTVNPFMISIAVKGLNESYTGTGAMSVGDGLVWRLVSWIILTTLAIIFVMWYANRVKKNPTKSVTFATREADKTFFLTNTSKKIEMTGRRKATLAIFGITFLFMILYLINWDEIFGVTVMKDMGNWIHEKIPYFNYTIPGFGYGSLEFVGSFFLLAAIVVGLINTIKVKKPANETTETMIIRDFVAGVTDIVSVSLVIATASGIGYVLVQSHMQELLVHALTHSLGGINSQIGKIIVLFILFIPLSFLIPSSTGLATAVFPLLTGIVQTSTGAFDPVAASGSITAFSFAEGLVNLITPTSGVIMGALALSRISYAQYAKVMLPVFGVLVVILIILLAIGGAIGGMIA